MSVYVLLALVAAAIIVPFFLGDVLARRLRMPDHGWKIGLILCTISLGALVVATGWPPKRGIDLSGGIILVYGIEQWQGVDDGKGEATGGRGSADQKDGDEADDRAARRRAQSVVHLTDSQRMERLTQALAERLNPAGVLEITIRQYGEDQIEIIIPEADENELRRIKEMIQREGTLEFRILANPRDHSPIIERALREEARYLYDAGGNLLAWWVPVFPGDEKDFAAYIEGREVAHRPSPRDPKILEILVVKDEWDVTGDYLSLAQPGEYRGRPAVDFWFDSDGARRFGYLTSSNLPEEAQNFRRKLGIILDGQLRSAPAIESTITDRGQIHGSFTDQDVEDLVRILNAGRLPARLSREPVSEQLIGPTLGRDTILRGTWSIALSTASIFIFMLVYYRFSGIVASLALLVNILLVVAIMIVIQARFTLPGLAGLVLTLGMAVDANVLIYERIREERQRGAALRMAIRNGFSRAMSAIIDSNVTTVITGIILYAVGTETIKGFAVTLILGLVVSMYTAIFCARVLFDIAEKQRWITELKMMRLFSATNIDFLRWGKLAIAGSIIVIVVGLAAVALRGKGILDVDFTGGVSVEIVFKQPKSTDEVRRKLDGLPDLTVTDVRTLEGRREERFTINTSFSKTKTNAAGEVVRTPIDLVEEFIRERFPGELASNVMTIREIGRIEAAVAPGTTTPEPTTPETTTPGTTVPAATEPGTTTPDAAPSGETSPGGTPPAGTTPSDSPATPAPSGGATQGESPTGSGSSGAAPKADQPSAAPADRQGRRDLPLPSELAQAWPLGLARGAVAWSAEGSDAAPLADAAPADALDQPAEPAEQPKTEAQRDGDSGAAGETEAEPVPAMEGESGQDDATSGQPAAVAPSDAPQPAGTDASESGDAPAAQPVMPAPSETTEPAAPAATPGQPGATPAASPAQPAEATSAQPAPSSQLVPGAGLPGVPAGEAFVGGTIAKVELSERISHDALEALLVRHFGSTMKDSIKLSNPDYRPGDGTPYSAWTIQIDMEPEKAEPVLRKAAAEMESIPYFPSSNSIGSRVAGMMRQQGLIALVGSLICIVIYLWVRFQRVVFGLAAAVAVVHDVLVTLGAIAISAYLALIPGVSQVLLIDPFKIGLTVLAAFLTIIGFSLNDTIVIFDRLREIRGKAPRLTAEMVNLSVNQTLSRTILTTGTVLLTVLVLYFAGGQGIHTFAFAMLVGCVVGTYSTIYIASYLALWLSQPKKAP